MLQDGRGLARIEGKVAFVSGALPGERVECSLVRKHKDYDELAVVEILEKHPQRQEPPCPYYASCGGCNLQHAALSLQREIKRQVLEDLFLRMAKINCPTGWILQDGEGWGYRHRVRWVRGAQGWGFRSEGSHSVTAVQHCPVLCAALQAEMGKLPHLPEGAEVQAFADTQGNVGLWGRDFPSPLKDQQVQLLGRSLWMDSRVFFQSNLEQLPPLITAVMEEARNLESRNLAVDLFSGVGVFASFLQDLFFQVNAVEWNPGCLRHARRNLGPNCHFVSASAEDSLSQLAPGKIDFLVVDPPRSGLSHVVRTALCKAAPCRMAYVSCDPVTLARDLGFFVCNRWKILRLEGFDFYPQTSHLETLAVLEPMNQSF